MPPLVHFLDYAAEQILLRKVGSGYIFIHRLLLEHLAATPTLPSPTPHPHNTPTKTTKDTT